MEIKEFNKKNNPKSPLKATFLVYIPSWDFQMQMSFFEREDGSHWFGYPQQEYTNKEGQKKYKWLAWFGEKAKPRFEKAIYPLVRNLLNDNAASVFDQEEPMPAPAWEQ